MEEKDNLKKPGEKKERTIPDVLAYVVLGLLIVSLLGNLYLSIQYLSNPREMFVEIPIIQNVTPDRVINKQLLLDYNQRAWSLCIVNDYQGGYIVIDNLVDDIYILCITGNETRMLNLSYVEILGEPSLIKR